jgi:Ribonuclease G/E
MSARRLFLDRGPGERRGVVLLDNQPERLIIERAGAGQGQDAGSRHAGRVRAIDRAAGLAFVELAEGPDGALNLAAGAAPPAVGAAVEVEIRSEPRAGKGAGLKWIGPAEGTPRRLAGGPDLEARLQAFAPSQPVETGAAARAVADTAQDEALETVFPLSGGGDVAIEATRALVSVDVDLGGRMGDNPKRAARAANLAALATAARVLRLKGLGGLVVIDLVGRGHDAPALLAAARSAFGPDNPGVAFGAVSRFGTIELTIPRRARPTLDILTDGGREPSDATLGLSLLRALQREALADGGGRFVGVADVPVIAAAEPFLEVLTAQVGQRVSLIAEPMPARGAFEVRRP